MRTAITLVAALAAVALCGCQPRSTTTETTPPAVSAAKESPPGPLPVYQCRRTTDAITIDGEAIEPGWKGAERVTPLGLWNGGQAKQTTSAALLWDNEQLYVSFACADADIQGSMKRRDQNLWEENEVVELFADAGGDQGCYLEFEVNPLNAVLDLVIPKGGGPGPIEGKKMWDAKGMKTAVHVTRPGASDGQWTVEMAIPLNCFLDAPNTPPKPGDEWRINLYRVDAVSDQVEYQAWSPTNTDTPNFHVPERFGVLRFVGGDGGEGSNP